MPAYSPVEWQCVDDFENVCKVNLIGSISVTLTFLPLIRETNGRIVNVCSVVSNVGLPGVANYCVSKAGLKMFTTCLRLVKCLVYMAVHVGSHALQSDLATCTELVRDRKGSMAFYDI